MCKGYELTEEDMATALDTAILEVNHAAIELNDARSELFGVMGVTGLTGYRLRTQARERIADAQEWLAKAQARLDEEAANRPDVA